MTYQAIALRLALTAVSATVLWAVPQADNTGKNKRDRAEGAITADQQGESKEDREMARKIRRALTTDKALSVNARNVKIVVRDGKVMLRGPVGSEEEKRKVEALAAEAAGQANITSQLEITNEKRKDSSQ